MLISFFKISTRNLLKNKIFTIINVTGLSIGITCVLFISLFVINEQSYEKHFSDYDRIYRVALDRIYPDRTKKFATSSIMLAPALKEQLPEIEAVTRLHRLFFQSEIPVKIEDKIFKETRFLFSDSNFFSVFNHSFIEGNPRSCLNDPLSVVLTETTAKRYFGRIHVIGETLKMDTVILKVTGVVKDQPSTTHLRFDLLGSINTQEHLRNAISNNNWVGFWVYTYIKARKGVQPFFLEEKVKRIANESGAANIASNFGVNYAADGHHLNYFLQPIKEIHLQSHLEVEVEANGNVLYVYLLSGVACIILLITIINYVSLSVSKSGERAKEIGVRKTLGAQNGKIKLQVFGESLFICCISLLISFLLLAIGWNGFSELVGREITFSVYHNSEYIFYVLVLIVGVSFLAAFYPASVFASIQPAVVLKGNFNAGNKGGKIRNALMMLQFSIAISMITGSIAVFRQMKYLRSKDLGFSPSDVMVIRQSQGLAANYQSFITKIKNIPGVEQAGGASTTALPGNFSGSSIFESIDNPAVADVRANSATFDDGFLEAVGFTVVAGRTFAEEFQDSASIIINEAAAKAFELNDPVGAKIRPVKAGSENEELTIIGIVKDYHFFSLHSPISPMLIFKSGGGALPVIAVKINPGAFAQASAAIKNDWDAVNEDPLEYTMLGQDLDKLYQADRSTVRVFNLFTILAILMCCIGLIGLTAYLAQQRLKELSIRRILGATQVNIIAVFSYPFVKMMLVSMMVAFLISFWLINKWLETYAYRQPLSIQTYAWAALLTFSILFLSLSIQFIRLTRLNPVKLLKEN